MRRLILNCIALLTAGTAFAGGLQEMIGTWRWQEFTVEVRECQGDSVCAKIVAGPKNVGMDVFASKLVSKGSEWFCQITHPETKLVYATRFQQKDKDHWRLDGCTPANVCLSGEFARVK